MNALVGWALSVAAVAAGYVGYGWRGVLLAVTVVSFWLLLQFSRALRVMRLASSRPMGSVASAVMLHTQLKPGLTLMQILPLTGSLGRKTADLPETFVWTDAGGDAVRIELQAGKLAAWFLVRAAATDDQPQGAEAGQHQRDAAGLGDGLGKQHGA